MKTVVEAHAHDQFARRGRSLDLTKLSRSARSRLLDECVPTCHRRFLGQGREVAVDSGDDCKVDPIGGESFRGGTGHANFASASGGKRLGASPFDVEHGDEARTRG
jgi:hypothetical protein